jgi:hypothetical protein
LFTSKITYTGTQDFNDCIVQGGTFDPIEDSFPCEYETPNFRAALNDLFIAPAIYLLGSNGPCTSATNPSGSKTFAFLKLSGGVYTLAIMGNYGLGSSIYFLGSTSVASPPCKIQPLSFTNTVVVGNIYSPTVFGQTISSWGFASGGTAMVVRKKSCCP